MKVRDICISLTDGSHNPPQGMEHSEYLMLSSKNVFDNNITFDEPRYLNEEAFNEENKRTNIKPGDVLLTIVGTVGRTAVVTDNMPRFTLQRSVAVLHPNTEICNSRFLMYALQGKRSYFEKNAKGVAQKGIYLGEVSAIDINIPTISEQVYEVEKLDSIRNIIQLRKQELSTLDDLIKARFVEMFGDRWANNKKWPQRTLAESVDFYNGKAHEQVVDENGEYILVTSRCIASDLTDYRRTNALLFPLKVGDICMVMSDVPNGKALAKCMRVDKENKYTLNQRICCFRNYDLNPTFFFYFLNRHEYLLSFNDGDSQTNLRKNDLLACPVIYPPMDLQEQFSTFVAQIDKSKVAVQKALDKAKLLFDSLMQQYFG